VRRGRGELLGEGNKVGGSGDRKAPGPLAGCAFVGRSFSLREVSFGVLSLAGCVREVSQGRRCGEKTVSKV